MSEEMPAHDLEAEQAALGGMLLSGDAITDVSALIGTGDYFRPAHQMIHAAITALAARGDPADPVTVKEELTRRGEIDRAGGPVYLHTLMQACPAAVNAGYYAAIVADKAERRRLNEAGAQVMQATRRFTGETAELHAYVAGLLNGHALTAPSRLPQPVRLDELLAEPDETTVYRIDRLWPAGGRVVLAAQRKAGKTTFTGNLLRCLADGDMFLDRYQVAPITGTVFHFDTEMPRTMLKRWLRDQGIRHPDRIHVELLRGRVSTFDILSPAGRAEWAALIRGAGSAVVTFDCIGPVLAALGLDENTSVDVGRFLVAVDQLLDEAGVPEGLFAHHMGHMAERSRGASRLRDWPDAEWKLVYEKQDGDREPGPAARRYFDAVGRDVAEPEQRLDYEPVTRRLSVGGGSRQDERAGRILTAILEHIANRPEDECSQSKIVAAVGGRAADARAVLDAAVADETLCMHRVGQAKLHRFRSSCTEHGAGGYALFDAPTPSTPSHSVPTNGTGSAQTPSPRPIGTGYSADHPDAASEEDHGTGSGGTGSV